MNRLLLLCSALLAILFAPSAQAADLMVNVLDLRPGGGEVKLLLFDREDGFREEDKARQVLRLPAGAGAVTGSFAGLPAGRYAVIAYHDENGDGKLNLRLGMFPKEGYGLSNNLKPLGPPKFADAAFDLPAAGLRVDIRLDY